MWLWTFHDSTIPVENIEMVFPTNKDNQLEQRLTNKCEELQYARLIGLQVELSLHTAMLVQSHSTIV